MAKTANRWTGAVLFLVLTGAVAVGSTDSQAETVTFTKTISCNSGTVTNVSGIRPLVSGQSLKIKQLSSTSSSSTKLRMVNSLGTPSYASSWQTIYTGGGYATFKAPASGKYYLEGTRSSTFNCNGWPAGNGNYSADFLMILP